MGERPPRKRRKVVPQFWWDFDPPASNRAIVESTDPEHKVIAVFEGPGERIAAQCLVLIADLEAGRQDYRRLAMEFRRHG